VRVTEIAVRNFRCYERAVAPLGDGVSVIWGANGAGKTAMLEAVYFGCTGRSCRTANDRELVRFGSQTGRVVVSVEAEDGSHELAVGFTPGEAKQMTVDGAPVERLLDAPQRPLVSVFLPERLELVRGAPAARRAHLDQLVSALWPSRAVNRRAYAQALAQRNALLTRVRAGLGSRESLEAWDRRLAVTALDLMADRAAAVDATSAAFAEIADCLGLDGEPEIAYRPRSHAADPDHFVAELAQRLDGDLERGFSGHGPHRDELIITRLGRELRVYGSQGQQRLGLLSLLMAERLVIAELRGTPPLMLLDDVMSELDGQRRQSLVELLQSDGGQAVITTTDAEHVPGFDDPVVTTFEVADGALVRDAALIGRGR
jgi:DNA replication and repair protein RecF